MLSAGHASHDHDSRCQLHRLLPEWSPCARNKLGLTGSDLCRGLARKVVYWFGQDPSPQHRLEFANRGLTLRIASYGHDLQSGCSLCRGLLRQTTHVNYVCERLSLAKQALDAGLMVCLLADDAPTQAHLEKHLPTSLHVKLQSAVLRKTGASIPIHYRSPFSLTTPVRPRTARSTSRSPLESSLTKVNGFC